MDHEKVKNLKEMLVNSFFHIYQKRTIYKEIEEFQKKYQKKLQDMQYNNFIHTTAILFYNSIFNELYKIIDSRSEICKTYLNKKEKEKVKTFLKKWQWKSLDNYRQFYLSHRDQEQLPIGEYSKKIKNIGPNHIDRYIDLILELFEKITNVPLKEEIKSICDELMQEIPKNTQEILMKVVAEKN